MTDDKTLPADGSDYSLPGRLEEGGSIAPVPQAARPEDRPKSRGLAIAVVAFLVVAGGFFAYYAANQDRIDSGITSNMSMLSPEQRLAVRYGVGEAGSAHAHAALALFVENKPVNFGRPQFQLQSEYIHFENHNPYLVHKHATGVPLEMLFASIGLDVGPDCIIPRGGQELCADDGNRLVFYVNGMQYENITAYEIEHGDRILVSYGDPRHVPLQLRYLGLLDIHDIPEKTVPGRDYSV